jgi:predicted RNase H-like HicB family nuclease
MGFGKRNRLHSAETERRRKNVETLLLFFLGGGKRVLGGLRLGGALLEFVHAAGGVHKLLLAGVKRVAHVANADDDDRPGGAGLDHVAAGATDFRVHIFRMNVRLHKKGGKPIRKSPDDKREFEFKNELIYGRRLIIVSAMNGMSEYCKDALKLAVVKKLGAGEGFSAKIPGFAGLVVFAPTRAEVMNELKSALEGWVELSLARGDGLPALHDLAVVA